MLHDAIVIGGSFAGLAAALQLARARRNVLVLDAGEPRNRFAEHSHGFLGQDGRRPGEILATARAQLAAYPTATIEQARAESAKQDGADFAVTLADGGRRKAARLVLAFGVRDELPNIPGLSERWGRSVLHCPYCHGYETRRGRLGVLGSGTGAVHRAGLISDWGDVTLFLDGGAEPTPEEMRELDRRGVRIEPAKVERLDGKGESLQQVVLAGGSAVPSDALFVASRTVMASPIAGQLGCAMEEGMQGPVVTVDGLKRTSVPGVLAAGDIARPMHSISLAVADGALAGVACHQSLVFAAAA